MTSGKLRSLVSESDLAKSLGSSAGAAVALVTENTAEVVLLGRGIDATTPLEIGSLTKCFTALLVAESVSRQELHLVTRVDELLLGERWDGVDTPITVEMLATHNSGLPRLSVSGLALLLHPRDPYRTLGREHLMNWLQQKRPSAPDPRTFSYSNFGYALLGLMLEKATSKPYDELLRDRLLKPLHMHETDLQLVGGRDRVLPGYGVKGAPASPWHWHRDGYAPCGAMVSTLNDLVLAVQSFMDADSPVAGPLADTLQPRAAIPGGHIGLAWILPPGGDSFWHNGGTFGFSSYLGISRSARKGVIIVANQGVTTPVTELGHQLLRAVAQGKQEGHL
jgi:D-alanyl-D-alanine-carboxypeptidase/D-alanyl-D-alanine-endopeptidase